MKGAKRDCTNISKSPIAIPTFLLQSGTGLNKVEQVTALLVCRFSSLLKAACMIYFDLLGISPQI